jgi:hypothetical protein
MDFSLVRRQSRTSVDNAAHAAWLQVVRMKSGKFKFDAIVAPFHLIRIIRLPETEEDATCRVLRHQTIKPPFLD